MTSQDIQNMMARAEELALRPGHYATDQFNNPYIIPGHRDWLGREIWEQTEGRVNGFTQGFGTAASLLGVAAALRPHGATIQALEAAGSPAVSGGTRGAFAMQGWAGSIPPQWDAAQVDYVDVIEDEQAFEMMLQLARKEGIFAGISTGANVVGAHRLAERLGPDAVIVTLAVDTAFRYLTVPHSQRQSEAPSDRTPRRSRTQGSDASRARTEFSLSLATTSKSLSSNELASFAEILDPAL